MLRPGYGSWSPATAFIQTTNQMRLHFYTEGQGDPVIILHGLLGSSDNWRMVSGKLAAHYQVLSADLRNHGRSPRSPEMNYELMAEDVLGLIEREGLARVRLLGHSMGGKVAMEFALRHADRVERLIVADMAPRVYPARHRPILDALRSIDLSVCSTRQQVEKALLPNITDPRLRQFLLKAVTPQPNGLLAWRFNLEAISDRYERLGEALREGRVCDQPALFIRGGASDYLLDGDFDPIRILFPRARFHTIPGAGHWLHAEAPGEFIEAVLQGFK